MKKMLAFLLGAVMLFSCGCAKKENSSQSSEQQPQKASAQVYIEGSKFMVNGSELWINGVNTPWINWNDFTGSMDEQAWEDTFKLLKEDNINCTRIWVNCNGENIVRLKTTGEIKNINENHWTDLDKLFALAEKYEIYVMPTLLSFDHFKGEKWQKLITSKENCDAFAEQYVAEFAKRYKDCEYIMGVDICNEPDWIYENEECGKIDWDNICYLFGKCASAIHENSNMNVTVGMGIVKYNSAKYEGDKISDDYLKQLTGDENSYVDFYSTHYYVWQKSWYGVPFNKSPEEFGIDTTKPVLVGETSNDDEESVGMSITDKYKQSYDNGWNGVMVWMEYRSDGTSGCDEIWYRYDLTQQATNAMNEYIPEKIHPAL